ncbi:hypothetical protein [Profundibacter sp.]
MDDKPVQPSLLKLGLYLYVFVMAAVAVNLFMLSLAWQRIGLPALSPALSVLISLPLAIPVTWLAARWARRLMEEADG